MRVRREAKRWLAAAREDLAYVRYATGGCHYAPACFYAQQAADKAVKAVHYARGARELDLFYVPARYPNGLDTGTPGEAFSAEQARRAIGCAEEIVEAAAGEVESS